MRVIYGSQPTLPPNLKLNNLTVVVDWNGSAAQLMPLDALPKKWSSFGWNCFEVDGHDEKQLGEAFNKIEETNNVQPNVIVAKTIKGKGVSFIEGHGKWHHKIPNQQEFDDITRMLEEK